MNGANREFFVARPEWLHKLPDGVDDAKAALIEPFTCGYYAVMRNGGTNAAETVVISGGGTIGLVSAAAAIGMGARVIVVDPVPLRREIALRLANGPTVAYRYMKENLNRAMAGKVEDCLDLEATHHVHCGQTEDHREATKAFVDKREPVFKGR